jgi:predicted lipoprotein with Yx(FWY)xxD motif
MKVTAGYMTTRRARALCIILGVGAAACSKHRTTGDSVAAGAVAMAPDSAAPAAVVSAEVAPGVVLSTVVTPGSSVVLADGNGRAVYVLDAPPSDTTVWKPVSGKSMPTTTDTSVKSSMLGTTTGPNGSQQATYNGKPLYYYKGDTLPNQQAGQGQRASGATGHLVNPNGNAATGRSAKK